MVLAFIGAEAIHFLDNEKNAAKWQNLYHNCPWSTVFQHSEYVRHWYKLYLNQFKPLLLLAEEKGELTGIFPLSISNSGEITGAGHKQAEYHCWLSRPDESFSFVNESLGFLIQNFPKNYLHLKYIPALAPVGHLQSHSEWKNRSFWKKYSQPVMEVDTKRLEAELKKKNRKEKINRLKRLGDLKFGTITDYAVFEEIIDELIIQNDFRKGAMYGKTAFLDDPKRKEFLLILFKIGLLHVSVTRVNQEIIASNVGLMDKKTIHLQGINTYSPIYGKYSPGILHFLMMGVRMAAEGLEEFDLTPGGADGYKNKLATSFKEVHELIVTSPINRVKWIVFSIIKELLKKEVKKNKLLLGNYNFALQKINNIKHTKSLISKIGFKNYLDLRSKYVLENKNTICLKIENTNTPATTFDYLVSKNKVEDLMKFSTRKSYSSKSDFLSDCLKRLEYGQQAYTLCRENELMACVWFIPADTKLLDSSQTKSKIPIVEISCLRSDQSKLFTVILNNILGKIFLENQNTKFLHLRISKDGEHWGKVHRKDFRYFRSMNTVN